MCRSHGDNNLHHFLHLFFTLQKNEACKHILTMMVDKVRVLLRMTAVMNQGHLCKPSSKGTDLIKSNLPQATKCTSSLAASSFQLPVFIQDSTGGTEVGRGRRK